MAKNQGEKCHILSFSAESGTKYEDMAKTGVRNCHILKNVTLAVTKTRMWQFREHARRAWGLSSNFVYKLYTKLNIGGASTRRKAGLADGVKSPEIEVRAPCKGE
ncbi:hypothetical protein [Parvibacter caecicola]|uniref:Uncharacterized protein n=1 Tax=Parvibacter caecicola TaxID=747645 RepID=A0A7W5GR60_9ACTN|nr:hypothetical protein [Parvibacter caecicola]MBB3171963.1 hypothetical protein [Parvibacter caecicola]MCR2041100.1 hypothetical protein [Parvibacter caecicola]RNL11699.1 hypothetical protein DMP11_02875 [Parvibacter caecicola]